MGEEVKKRRPRSRREELRALEEALGYVFEDRALLERALTHRSYANERRNIKYDNQRLEFLGDSVLGLVIAEALFLEDEKAPEGALSSQLSELVCETALVERAEAILLGDYLLLGRGEEQTGGRRKDALLGDAFEAVLGAIFLDGGHEAARQVILAHFEQAIEQVISQQGGAKAKSPRDFKSLLQRVVQSRHSVRPQYRIVEVLGPPHERVFTAEVMVKAHLLGQGEGTSKKAAEQAAAAQALEALESLEGDWESVESESVASRPDSG